MRRGPIQDVMVTFGVITTIFTIYQMVETAKAKARGDTTKREHLDILNTLRRIEKKLEKP